MTNLILAMALAALSAAAQSPRSPTADDAPLTPREKMLLERIERLESRLAALEKTQPPAAVPPAFPVPVADAAPPVPAKPEAPFGGLQLGLTVDGYYAFNFDHPYTKFNLLRAYDVSQNSFSLNQATMVLARDPDVAAGRRFGVRVDLQYGQASEVLQGSPANEPRPEVYRPVFQAYGTYVFPLGKGLTVDFGKFSSALGYEGTYTKDQFNYSRGLLFSVLPFYHFGFRSLYTFNDKANLTYWLVNGLQQSEDFNGFKSQAVLLNLHPAPSVSWNLDYYTGQEQRTDAQNHTPDGRTHILDTYAAWNASKSLTLAAEFDYVLSRNYSYSHPSRLFGGAVYARWQAAAAHALAGRVEYLQDRDGLFSGSGQALKEFTGTYEYKFAEGFLMRTEYRKDFSNLPYFVGSRPGALKRAQDTAILGLVWWIGNRQGSW